MRLLRASAAAFAALVVIDDSFSADAIAEPFARFKFATQTLTIPAGFTVELVAAPPMVNRPISIAFDERGRLYATDSSGLSDKAEKQFEQKPHRIVRLEDTNGDGRFDRHVVFADRMMFPQGALFHEGSLFVAAPPHIWKLTDTNDDGVADRREIWFDGKTLTGCANDVHGPYLGPDGWFYWTKGAFAEQRHTLGNGKPFVTRAAHIFRARPDGSGFEPVLTGGMDNPVGVAFSATGERFLSGTFFQVGAAGKRDGLIHAIYGGVYGKENAAVSGHARTGDLMPIMTHLGAAAPCGSATYRSHGFGADFTENLFVCSFNLRKVSRHQLVANGGTFTTKDTDFVTSDSLDFRPTDVLEDADGSLLIVDTGGWYKICCPTSQLAKPDVLGGIYRVRKTGTPPPADPRGENVPWPTSTPADLAILLGDPRPYVQDRAIDALAKRGAAAIDALHHIVTHSASSDARRNAVWALARIERPAARAAIRAALNDREASVAHAASHATSLARDLDAVESLVTLLAHENAALVRLAAEALGRIGDARAIEPLLAAARTLNTAAVSTSGTPTVAAARVLDHALIHALIELGRREELRAQLNPSDHPAVIRAALVALDQMDDGRLAADDVIGWLDSSEPMIKRTAGWIVERHPEWGEALGAHFRTQLATLPEDESERTELQTRLARLAKSGAIQEVLATVAQDSESTRDARLLALRAMAAAGLKETPASWFAAIATLLSTNDITLLSPAIATARVLPAAKVSHPAFSTALLGIGRNPRLVAELRLNALAALPAEALPPMDAELFSFLCAHLASTHPMQTRSAAAAVLARAPLSPEQQLALIDALGTSTALDLPKLLPAFEKNPSEALGLKLVAALKQSPGLSSVRAHTLKPLLAKYPASVQRAGDALLASLNSDAASQNARIDHLLATLGGGDVRRGQAVFNSEKTACAICHVIGYHGGKLGPDLTTIGKIRTERELLEAVVYPSATFVRGFEPFTATAKNGESHSGLLRKDADDEVVLAIGPDTEQRITRTELANLQPGTVSPMPPGMDAVLTAQELADLVAFLKSCQ